MYYYVITSNVIYYYVIGDQLEVDCFNCKTYEDCYIYLDYIYLSVAILSFLV